MTRLGLHHVICLTACAAVVGCATPNAVVYTSVNVPPRAFARRAPSAVDVFVGKPPVRPYVDVGLFEVYEGRLDDNSGRSTEDMLGSLRAHAALRGCDALQVLGVELAGKEYLRVVRGVCEMYTDPQAIEADKNLKPQPLPGEGQACGVVSGSMDPRDPNNPSSLGNDLNSSNASPSSGASSGCTDPLVCSAANVCASPYQ